MLLCGGECKGNWFGFVVVLDSDSLSCQHTLRLNHLIERLLSMRGKVWGRLWMGNVVVWGKVKWGDG